MSEVTEPNTRGEKETPAAGGAQPATGGAAVKSVPYERFQEVNHKYREARAELEKLKAARNEESARALEERDSLKALWEEEKKTTENLLRLRDQQRLENAVDAELAGRVGITDPERRRKALDAARKLIDRGALTLTADGVSGVTEAVTKIIRDLPELFSEANPKTDPAAVSSRRTATGARFQNLTVADIMNMDDADFAEFDRSFRSGRKGS